MRLGAGSMLIVCVLWTAGAFVACSGGAAVTSGEWTIPDSSTASPVVDASGQEEAAPWMLSSGGSGSSGSGSGSSGGNGSSSSGGSSSSSGSSSGTAADAGGGACPATCAVASDCSNCPNGFPGYQWCCSPTVGCYNLQTCGGGSSSGSSSGAGSSSGSSSGSTACGARGQTCCPRDAGQRCQSGLNCTGGMCL
jgi:hypothetical protein